MSRKDNQKLLRAAKRAGAVVILGGSHHWRVYFKGAVVTVSGSPSDRNAHKQAARQLRRVGLEL